MGQSEILSELHSATETLKTLSCDCLQGMVSPLIRDEPISPIINAIKANPEATHRLGYQINRDTFDAAHHSNAGIASVQAM
jgi:hypothetical protein